MNGLLQHFDLLATAPGGVARLRELILTLAVQGKLVPQDPDDEPASVLLQKIRAEKDRLIAEGKSKRDKPLAPITDEEKPFELPVGWEWVHMGDLVNSSEAGWSPSCHNTPRRAGYWGVLKVSAVSWGAFDPEANKELPAHLAPRPECEVHDGDFLLSRANTEDLVAKSVLVEKTPPMLMLSDKLIRLHIASLMNRAFLNLSNNASHSRAHYIAQASGTSSSMKNVSREVVLNLLVALPPLVEQSRIVARVEELMRLCDALEAKGQLDAKQHAQLLQTLLGTLTDSATLEELAAHWQRVAEHFDLLLDRPEAVDALEQTLLQLAVRGLLVPQDPSDEPASVLLQRVQQGATSRSAKTRKLNLPGVDDVTPLYALPSGWSWSRLGDLVENMGSGWSPACDEGERSNPERWAVLRTTAVQLNEYRPWEHKVIPSKLSPRPEIEVKEGDILITRAGPMNRVGISCWVDSTPPRLMLSDKIIRFHSIADEMLPAFIVLALNSGWTKSLIEAAKTGMAASQVNISQADLRALWMPVCSKAEQYRIVARVEELCRLCSDLRQRLTASRATQGHLAEALVATGPF